MNHPFLITEKGKLIDQVSLDVETIRRLTKEIIVMLNKALDTFKTVK
jgi:hypothetical protein